MNNKLTIIKSLNSSAEQFNEFISNLNKEEFEINNMKTSFKKFIYIGFILFGVYELVYRHSPGEAASFMGIALAFDPFDQEKPWKERPTWQKAVLIIHLAAVAALFGYLIGNSESDLRKGFSDGWNRK